MLRPRPQVRRDYPLSLSISISGGKETYKDSLSNGGSEPGSAQLENRTASLSELVLEIVGREANGGRRCVPVGCGTAIAGPPIDSGRGPVADWCERPKPRAVDRPRGDAVASIVVGSTRRLGDIPACSRHRPVGTPFGPS
ncbi:hypothetical protein L1887_43185 [Cichorium endivia]|nr:hypothetical protein L1887_43185 [Cichorium endivia]